MTAARAQAALSSTVADTAEIDPPIFTDGFEAVMVGARVEATVGRDEQIGSRHLGLALLDQDSVWAVLGEIGADLEALRASLS